ncbi:hypothetical protein [Tateyamaria sp. Alg231-49]|uniref:hypothetical protein n=1 Tax=Tateyamaria sp. Alg231-49 TaxID=1922219 RepID=UPI000D55C11E|nr:hypothetical protein [Tateyamaria sp. Alg231-49]
MEWLWFVVVGLLIVGVLLAVRERRTGRGRIIDERGTPGPQTEADREAMRAQEAAHHHRNTPHDHQ